MTVDVMQLIALIVSVVGFVGIWLRVGVYKGQTDNRIKVLETRMDQMEQKSASMQSALHAFEVKVSEVMIELKTKIGFILSGIDELKKKKQEGSDAEKK